MTYFAICGMIGFLAGLPCALFVFLNKPHTPVKYLSSFYSFVISLWGIGIFIFFTTTDHDTALFCDRMLDLIVAFIPLFFFHFVILLTNTWQEHKREAVIYYFIFGVYLLACILWPQYATKDVIPRPGFRFYPVSGPIFDSFTFFFFFAYIHGGFILYKAYQKASMIRRNQYKYFALATLLALLGASTSFFWEFNIPIFPFGVIMVPAYMMMVAYIIIKHRLMDIRIVIRKGVIYTLLASFITLFYLASIYLVERMFHNVLGYQSTMGSISVIVLIGILFVPLKDSVQTFVDRYFFKATYLQVVEQNDILKQQAVRADRYQTMSALSRRIIDEMRSPLTALVGYGYHLPKRLDDPAFLNKFVTVFDKELQRMQTLIQQLSDFSEMKPLDLKPVNVISMIDQLLEHLSEHIQKKNIKVFKHYGEDEERMAQADAEQIKRALYIFLANSVKSTSANGQVWIGVEDSVDGLEISIKDTGEGLSQEDLSQIFDPFFSTTKGGDEANVSLAQAQNIISHHGGKVMVDSQLNVGTEWIIQLPGFSKV